MLSSGTRGSANHSPSCLRTPGRVTAPRSRRCRLPAPTAAAHHTQDRTAGEVAVQVVGHVDAFAASLIQLGNTISAWLLKCEMCTGTPLSRRCGRPRPSNRARRPDRSVAVRDIDAAERRHFPAQRDQLLGRRIPARNIVEPGRQPDGALLHRFPHHAAHLTKFRAIGGRVSRPKTSMRRLPLGTRHATLRHSGDRTGPGSLPCSSIFAATACTPEKPAV